MYFRSKSERSPAPHDQPDADAVTGNVVFYGNNLSLFLFTRLTGLSGECRYILVIRRVATSARSCHSLAVPYYMIKLKSIAAQQNRNIPNTTRNRLGFHKYTSVTLPTGTHPLEKTGTPRCHQYPHPLPLQTRTCILRPLHRMCPSR